MIFRRNRCGLGVALSLAALYSGFSAPALAQDAAPPVGNGDTANPPAVLPAPPPAPDTAAAPGDTGTKPTDTAAPPSDVPAGTAVKEPAKADEPLKPMPPAPTASGTSVEREKTVSLVGVELLPGSAYPSAQTRGITYGSLWLTFHGQQWPYMPLIEGGPGLRIGLSGSLWNDLSYTHIAVDSRLATSNINDQKRWTTQTRGVFRVTPTYNAHDGWFVQGNSEFVVHGDQRPDPGTGVLGTTDDLWVRAGKWDLFDVTVGRFQGWEIANHYGMALDQNTLERSGAWIVGSSLPKPTDGYGLTYFWDRQDYTLGGYALHVYPTKYLRGELLGHIGAGNNTSNPYQFDVRPAGIFDIGYVKLKAGWEYGKAVPQDVQAKVRDTRNGYGFAAQFVFAPYVEFGGSFARGFEDVVDKDNQADLNGSNTVQTYGGFLNASPGYQALVLGFGAFQNHSEDFRPDSNAGPHYGKVDTNDQTLIFEAIQYTLWEHLYLKFVLSQARNHVESFNAGIYTNNALSGRFRAMILF
ncbi:MAG TPA: hypothetical protein VGI10_22455 [Polyangiaceae bacterium]